jgi:murein DD-endopeptidase MepM/ murein hydrolase activator NlpD
MDEVIHPGRSTKKQRKLQNSAHMIRDLKRKLETIERWINKQRKGRFAQSTALSLLTRPLWQYDKIKAWMGAPLVAAAVAGAGLSSPPVDALQSWDVSQPITVVQGYNAESDYTYLLPVASLTGISQYFHAGHPGIDFRAPLRSDVVAMDNGTVTAIVEQPYGYGRHVYVTHENGNVALYAHLGLIMVEHGEQIKAGNKIGEIGMTGRTTGPHLHFELRNDSGRAINPIPMLSKSLASLSGR